MKSALLLVAALAGTARADDAPVVQSFLGLDIIESANRVSFPFHGPAPTIDHLRIDFVVRDNRLHELEAKTLVMVSECGKRRPPKPKRLRITGYDLSRWGGEPPVQGTASIRTPVGDARSYVLQINFDGVTTTTGCAYVIDLIVDRVRMQVKLPLTIAKEFPIL
jgi:hypothetical protein